MDIRKDVFNDIHEGDIAGLTDQELTNMLSADIIARDVRFVPEVDSTNIYATELALHGSNEGTVVLADCQLKGKGRLNRVWQSPPGKNLYTSIILRPAIAPFFAPQLTLAAGVAVAEVLSIYCPDTVTLKWPNDVQIKKKKVCGILTEMRTTGTSLDFVIIGIGININIRHGELDESFRDQSTSLFDERGTHVSRADVAARLYDTLDRWYATYLRAGFHPVRDAWLAYSGIVDKIIQVNNKNETITGTVIGLDDYGALLIFDEHENKKKILAGDVVIIGDK
jgi:BirA family biotin operon repressor/biotin-[acetyl-CoA-carboxylase] ligase